MANACSATTMPPAWRLHRAAAATRGRGSLRDRGPPARQLSLPATRKEVVLRRDIGLRGLDPALFERPKSGFVLPFDRWIRPGSGRMDETMRDPAASPPSASTRDRPAALAGLPGRLPGMYWSRVWAIYVLIDGATVTACPYEPESYCLITPCRDEARYAAGHSIPSSASREARALGHRRRRIAGRDADDPRRVRRRHPFIRVLRRADRGDRKLGGRRHRRLLRRAMRRSTRELRLRLQVRPRPRPPPGLLRNPDGPDGGGTAHRHLLGASPTSSRAGNRRRP